MAQTTINERLKFLIESLGMSARAFSAAIGTGDTNTRNYLDRGSKPGADYLEKIVRRFETVNSVWLLTGDGEPFTAQHSDKASTTANVRKNSGVVGTNGTQLNIEVPTNLNDCQSRLAVLAAENEGLRNQIETLNQLLASKDTVIAGKDDLLAMLRGGINRIN